jgi:hypothetical protein
VQLPRDLRVSPENRRLLVARAAATAAHLPPTREAYPDAYLLVRPSLPSAGGHRETLPGWGRPHLVGDPEATTQRSPDGHAAAGCRPLRGVA